MADNKRAKEIEQLRNDLGAKTDVIVGDAIKKIAQKGDASLIPDLVEAWETHDDSIKKQVEDILYGLKSTDALGVLINAIDQVKTAGQKGLVLSAIWQSGYSAGDHLDKLVDVALSGTYHNAMDVMTIIEASELDETHEDAIDANLVKIKEQLMAGTTETAPLILEIKSILIDKKIDR